MLITTHVLSGAAIGAVAGSPVQALAAGFASHFVLDAVPHWGCAEHELMRVAVPDGLLGLAAIGAVAGAAAPVRRLAVLSGVFGACLPDVDKPGQVFFGRSPFPARFDAFHHGIQREAPHRARQEVLVMAGFAVLTATLLRRRR